MSNEQFHTGNWVWHKAEKEPVKILEIDNNNISRELQKMKSFFEHQKETIQKLGLESVKKHRLDKLELEEIKFQQETRKLKDIHPEFKAISIVYVKGAK